MLLAFMVARAYPRVRARARAAPILAMALCVGCSAGAPSARQRAALLVDKGQEREAAQVLRDYLRDHPDAIAERRLLIRVVAVTGDLAAVEREVEALAARLGPRDPTPFIELGHAFELNHRYEQALAMYDRAAELAPSDAAGPREGGMRAARWGEIELAAPRLEEALRRDPRDAKLWHALGVVRLELGDVDGAQTAYRSGLEADPGSVVNRLGLATIAVKLGDARSALEHYDAIVRARPALGDAQLGRSWALIGLGRLDEAEAALAAGERLGATRRAIAAQRRLIARLRARTAGGSPARP
jgi:tetratricopeptide (TPR) repeat protein